jgi:hypothetical protein
VDPLTWVTHRLGLDELVDGFEAIRADPGLIKGIVTL